MIAEYHSQHGEDKWIRENLNPPPGLFVEVGAFDGIAASNTLHFEKNGWSGLLVEADPEMAWKCSSNRSSPTICCAVGKGGTIIQPFHINMQDRGLSGLKRSGEKAILSPVLTLEILMGLEIDLLGIDTEGTELEVWSSRGSHRPSIVIMEYLTIGNPPNDAAIVEQMTKDRYKEVHRTACNLIFTRA